MKESLKNLKVIMDSEIQLFENNLKAIFQLAKDYLEIETDRKRLIEGIEEAKKMNKRFPKIFGKLEAAFNKEKKE